MTQQPNRGGAEVSQDCLTREIPIKLSMAGTNAYYHACEVYGGRSNYAVCQHTIDAVREGRVQLRSACQDAVLNGSCPAIKMREREQEAGRALFYIDRVEQLKALQEANSQPSNVVTFGRRARADNTMKTTRASEADVRKFEQRAKDLAPAPTKKPNQEFDADLAGRNLLGEAIGNMMKKETQ